MTRNVTSKLTGYFCLLKATTFTQWVWTVVRGTTEKRMGSASALDVIRDAVDQAVKILGDMMPPLEHIPPQFLPDAVKSNLEKGCGVTGLFS